jgi:hypothetical protein
MMKHGAEQWKRGRRRQCWKERKEREKAAVYGGEVVNVDLRERRFNGSVSKEVEEVPVQDTEERQLQFME